MSGLREARAVSVSTAGYEDGLGRRSVRFDREIGGMLECLHLRAELWAFETALRQRADAISALDDERFVRVRSVERSAQGLVVISELVAGQRLIDILEARQHDDTAAFGIDAALGFLLRTLPALSTLHSVSIAHGAFAPGRIIITPAAQVVLLDGIYGAALERLNLSRPALWSTLGILALPFAGANRFDRRSDVMQAALCALTLTLGRQAEGVPSQAELSALVHEVTELAEIRAGARFGQGVKEFFSAALPVHGRAPEISTDDAASIVQRLATLIGEEEAHGAFEALTRFESIAYKVPAFTEEDLPEDPERLLDDEEPASPAAVQYVPPPAPAAAPPARPAPAAPPAASVARTPVPLPPQPAPAPPPAVVVPLPRPAAAAPAVVTPPAPPPVKAPAAIVPPPTASVVMAPTTIVSPPVKVPTAVAPPPVPAVIAPPPTPAVAVSPPVKAPVLEPAPISFAPPPAPSVVVAPPTVQAPAPVAVPKPVVPAPIPAPLVAAPPTITPPVVTPPPFVAQAPPPAPVVAPAPITIAPAPPAQLRVRTEPPSGYTPAQAEAAPQLRALPFVDRVAADEPRQFPWKIAAAAVVVLSLAGLAGWTFMPGTPSAAPDTRPVAAEPVVPAPVPSTTGKTGELSVESQPAGARVLLDGTDVGVTPLKLDSVEPGRHAITITNGTATVKRTVRIEAGRALSLDVPIFSGWVAVFSPIPLDIASGGITLGNTDTGKIMLPPGRHVLTLSNREFGFTENRTVEIHPGEERPLNIEPKGLVNVNAHPWAEVLIDGKKAGDTPIANLPVLLGTRVFVFRHPQYGERRVTQTITAAGAALSIDLTKPSNTP